MNNTTKAKKHFSPKLQELLNEITPIEMEQTKVKMLLAARIEDLMNSKGLSKMQFAEKVGKNPSEITKWLSGTQNFTIDILTEITTALEVDLMSLFSFKQCQEIYKVGFSVRSAAFQPQIMTKKPLSQCFGIFGNSLSVNDKKTFITMSKSYQA